MPINTDLNISPYYDDFDESKQYHRILFNPSMAVQARELTQLQTIQQKQIERFGNWAFQNGDIVSGCAIKDLPILPYIRLSDFQANGIAYNPFLLANTLVVSSTSNLSARVILSNTGLVSNYPNTAIAYVQYINTGNNGATSFSNNETLTFYNIPITGNNAVDIVAVVNSFSNSTANTITSGNAHGISVSEGIVYLNGNFVKVLNPTFGLVNNYSTNAANNVVGFQLIESIITENQDASLLDGALGYSNENAPGAHRLKLSPILISLDANTASNTVGFNPIAVYNYGSLITKSSASSNVYSIIGSAISERIYDEAGNYVVNPFTVDTITSSNTIIANINSNSVLARVGAGIGYAQGYKVEIQKTAYVNVRRGVDTQSNRQQQITFNYGGYLVINEVAGSFDFNKAQTVNLYDTPQQAVTNKVFSSLSPVGNLIGTAILKSFTYNSGIIGTNVARYDLHIFNIKMNSGYNVNQIKSVYYNGTNKGVGDLAVNGLVGSAFKEQLYSFGTKGLKNLRDSSNNNNVQYVYRTKSASTMYSNGVIVITLGAAAPGGTDIIPFGVGILPDVDSNMFNVAYTANGQSNALAGTISVYNTNNAIVGSGSTFLNTFIIGNQILIGSTIKTVQSITNNTLLTVDSASNANASAQTYYKYYAAGKMKSIEIISPTNPAYVSVTNTTSFSIITNFVTASGPSTAIPVDVTYNVLRTNVSPAQKVINRDRFVKINTAGNPLGPWCLGVSDISKITKVYGSGSSYSTTGTDLTSNFIFDSGQKDTHYDLGYLYTKGGYDTTSNPFLLVQLDYFTANTAGGSGFFTVESYPIDDVNIANTNAIQTKDIPLYIDEAGSLLYLRDYVDFRPQAILTANNTGLVNTANSSQITTAISYATINPTNALTLNVSNTGLNVPAYGQNFQSDYTFYLPRKDLILITPDNVIKIKEGKSSASPQIPLYPENAMTVAVLNIPPYPSLTTDQVDAVYAINNTSKNIIRDISTAINSNIVTNRRYTMSDIGKLDKRITNLEYYTTLSLLEKSTNSLTVTDAYGLNRFKNGIFVDPFNDFSLSDVSNPEFTIAIDSTASVARPKIVREVVAINFNGSLSTNTQKTGRVISLPYAEVTFYNQPYSTKYRSAAPAAFAWNGFVTLLPSYDNHKDIINTGSVSSNTTLNSFSNSVFNSSFGDWRTTTHPISNFVATTTPGTSITDGSATTWLSQKTNNGTGIDYIQGGNSYKINPAGNTTLFSKQ